MIKYLLIVFLFCSFGIYGEDYSVSPEDAVVIAALTQDYSGEPKAAERWLKTKKNESDQIWFSLAGMYIEKEEWGDSERLLTEILTRKPAWLLPRINLVSVLMTREKYNLAIVHITFLLDHNYDDKNKLRHHLAYCLLKQNKYFAASKAYEHALIFDPDSRELNRGLVSSLLNAGLVEESLALALQLLEQYPDDKELLMCAVYSSINTEHNYKALALLVVAESMSLLNAKEQVTLIQLACSNKAVGVAGSTVRSLQTNDLSVNDLLNCVYVLIQTENRSLAKVLLNKIDVDKDRPEYIQFCELSAMCSDDLIDSIALLRGAVDVDPLNGRLLLMLATRYRRNNENDEAEWILKRCSRIKGEYEYRGLLALANLYVAEKEYDAAVNVAERAFSIRRSDQLQTFLDALKQRL